MLRWWKSVVNRSFFLCLAACRTRSSAWDTLARSCARRVRCWRAFPLVPALRSTGSAAGRPALFVGFTATMARSDAVMGFHRELAVKVAVSHRDGGTRSERVGLKHQRKTAME